MDLALVDVVTSSVIGTELEARIAAAFVGAPIIYTAMLAQPRVLLALVDIHAFSVVVRLVLESRLAVTAVRPDAVNTLGVGRTWPAVLVKLALVDVFAVAVVGRHEASRADTFNVNIFV